MLKSNLCDYSDACIVVKATITIASSKTKKINEIKEE